MNNNKKVPEEHPVSFVGDHFVEQIQVLVKANRLSYIDAVVYWCEIHGLEIDVGAELVEKSSLIKTKIEEEAESLNFIKKVNRLPV